MTWKTDKKYTTKQLQDVRCRLNGGSFSDSWYREHFRRMLEELFEIKKGQEGTQ